MMARKAWRRCVGCGRVVFSMTTYHKYKKNGVYRYCGAFRVVDKEGEPDITAEEKERALGEASG